MIPNKLDQLLFAKPHAFKLDDILNYGFVSDQYKMIGNAVLGYFSRKLALVLEKLFNGQK